MRIANVRGRLTLLEEGGGLDVERASNGRFPADPQAISTDWEAFRGWAREAEGAVMPVVLDTPWAGVIDAVGGVSLSLYDRLSRWKREAALRRPEESTGFRVVARKRS